MPSESELLDEAKEKADYDEEVEYITKDPVKKWQYTDDTDIFMVGMCKENEIRIDDLKPPDVSNSQSNQVQ